ncbi:MAG: acyltransferase [Candidatus Omnitrophota bacterium]|nr:acyltransferase [Candidatus Omnitrophota bacterium]MDZ4243354.1 acyltransferase [Candidatus Omnitrophota bacterium]
MIGQKKSKNYYPFMDTFRGISILWVIMHHVDHFFDMETILGPALFPVFHLFARVGFLGVDMFFVISGFLITGVLLDDLRDHVRVKRFYLRRFFKIGPQYFLAVVIGLAVSCWLTSSAPGGEKAGTAGLWGVLGYFVLLQNYMVQDQVLAHTWSLAIEEHFYLIYPLILAWVCRRAAGFEDRRRALICFLVIVIGLINLVKFIGIDKGLVPYLFDSAHAFQTTHYRIDALMFGCLLKYLEPWLSPPPGKRDTAGAVFFFAAGILLYAYLIWTGVMRFVWFTYMIAYLAPGAIFISALKGLSGQLDHPWLRWVGKSSYGTYLWHYIVAFPLLLLMPVRAFHHIGTVALYVILCLAVGTLSTRTWEKYFLRLRDRVVP